MTQSATNSVSSDGVSVSAGDLTGSYPGLVGGNNRAPENTLPRATMKKVDLERVAEKLNTASASFGRDLRFRVDLNEGEVVIQVLDQETGEIIRQIPAKEAALISKRIGTSQLHFFDDSI